MEGIWGALGMLAAVVAVLVFAYYCTRYIAKRGMTLNIQSLSGASAELCVLGQLNLGKGERLVLVKVHNRCLLLGVTEKNISVLTELSEEESEAWLEQADEPEDDSSNFLEVLKGSITKKK